MTLFFTPNQGQKWWRHLLYTQKKATLLISGATFRGHTANFYNLFCILSESNN